MNKILNIYILINSESTIYDISVHSTKWTNGVEHVAGYLFELDQLHLGTHLKILCHKFRQVGPFYTIQFPQNIRNILLLLENHSHFSLFFKKKGGRQGEQIADVTWDVLTSWKRLVADRRCCSELLHRSKNMENSIRSKSFWDLNASKRFCR